MQNAWVPGFFFDGYLYTLFGKNAAEKGYWLVPHITETYFSRFDQHPPTIFILEGLFFKLFGSSYTSARIFGALPALLSATILAYFLIRTKNKKWGLLAGIIFLLMPSFIKKARFPALDIPLTLTFCATYFSYYYATITESIKHKYLWWILTGFFWGAALLIKGPFALVIAPALVTHLLLHKKFSTEIKTFAPIVGFIIGIILFCLWPLSLYLTHNFDIFQRYLDGQLFNSIVNARGSQDDHRPLTYIYHLTLFAGPWLLLALLSFYQAIRAKKIEPLHSLFLCWFLFLLIPLSLMKWKYSHYMLPLYPALAALAAYPLKNISDRIANKIFDTATILFLISGLILLVFPISNTSKRNIELFKTVNFVRTLQTQPKTWLNVDGYPQIDMSNMISLECGISPETISVDTFLQMNTHERSVAMIKASEWEKIKDKKSHQFSEVIKFNRENISVIITNDLLKTPYLY